MNLTNQPIRNETTAVFSSGMLKVPHLEALIGVRAVLEFPRDGQAGDIDFVVGWGTKPTARRARAYAKRNKLRYVALEDGFLRSAGSASAKLPPVSFVVDDAGIYYEAGKPSRVERLIRDAERFDSDIRREAEDGFARFLRHRLTKYNTVSADTRTQTRRRRWRVLLVDQVFGDQSIAGGLASAASFDRMIRTALATFTAADIGVKVHPDVLAGRARGYIDRIAIDRGLDVIADQGNPHDLLETVDEVWTVTSQLGLEAVFKGVPVRCFGVPFYAGWGLTEDTPDDVQGRMALARRGAARTPLDVFAAAYVAYPNYADPVSGAPIALSAAIDRLLDWRTRAERNREIAICGGWPMKRRGTARAVFGDGGSPVAFTSRSRAERSARADNSCAYFWEMPPAKASEVATPLSASLVREGAMSVFDPACRDGLGSSVVVDNRAAGLDRLPRTDIEWLLSYYPFEDALRRRASELRKVLCPVTPPWAGDGGKKVIAVLGERFDAARRDETEVFATNLAFLDAVRAEYPEAEIVYVEHPALKDRRAPGWIDERQATGIADRFEAFDDILCAAVQVDEVHTIASDTGFAALMAEHRVVTWGRPLYAGWGLTSDRQVFPGRKRRLSVDQMAAAALILLPRYIDVRSGIPCDAEDVARRIEATRLGRLAPRMRPRTPWHAPLTRFVERLRARIKHFVFFA